MNQSVKPKTPKLWKNVSNEQKESKKKKVKKEKNMNLLKNEKTDQESTISETNKPLKNKQLKRMHSVINNGPNQAKKIKTESHDVEHDVNDISTDSSSLVSQKKKLKKKKKSGLKTEITDSLDSSMNNIENNSQTENASLSTIEKKAEKKKVRFSFNNEVQIMKTNSKGKSALKRKNENSYGSPAKKKGKFVNQKSNKQKPFRRENNPEKMEFGKKLKLLWEEFRRGDCNPEKRGELLKQVCNMLKGRVKEVSFAHDTVRVLESVLALGAETHRSLLFDELKDDIIPLSKSKYGKFFVLKLLKYGTKQHKDYVIKSFHGKVISLIKHVIASEVIETAFNECANATQRSELVQEFYGASYKYFKDSNVHSLSALLEKNPEQKPTILKNMKEQLMGVLNKTVVRHSIVHYILLQYLNHCDSTSRSEIIESLREVVPEILHTKDGSRVAMQCVWHGSVKDRKIIIKSMKMFVSKVAKEEHGHLVLLALFDCVDDYVHLKKNIITELMNNSLELCQNIHGKKVLTYLLSPRDPLFIHPDVINILKPGDSNEISKKSQEDRWSELKNIVAAPLLKLITTNISTLYKNNSFCLFALCVLQHAIGDKTEAFKSISTLVNQHYTTDTKGSHPIELPGCNFFLKKLILWDKEEWEKNKEYSTFSEMLVNTVSTGVLKTWTGCNRGAFLLVSLLETEIPIVVEKIKEELVGCKTQLSKKNYKGAEILLKKLRDQPVNNKE